MTQKPTILLCWGYNRIGWIEIFEKINPHFNFIYLFFYSKELEDKSFTNNPKIYYNDFSSPRKIIAYTRPSKIIFMGLDGPLPIALNIYAKRKGITSYFMMHGGVSFNVADFNARAGEVEERPSPPLPGLKKLRQWLFTLRFLTYSLKINEVNILSQVLRFRNDLNKYTNFLKVFIKYQYSWRFPDKYIIFSKNDEDYFILQDGASKEDFLTIGSIESQPYFEYHKQGMAINGGYILYLETPLSPIAAFPNDPALITKERYNQLILLMNNYSMENGLKLVVKLHPYNYLETDYVQHPNISYLTDTDKVKLIMNANGVIGFDSSLFLTAVNFKRSCILIKHEPNSFQRELIKLGFPYADIETGKRFPDFLKTDITSASRERISAKFLEGDKTKFPAESTPTDNLISILKI